MTGCYPFRIACLGLFILLGCAVAISANAQGSLTIDFKDDGSIIVNNKHYANVKAIRSEDPKLAKRVEALIEKYGTIQLGTARPGKTKLMKPVDNPPDEKETAIARERLMGYLNQQMEEGLSHPSGKNAIVVTYAVAGLAYLAMGAKPGRATQGKHLNKCLGIVIRDSGKQIAREVRQGNDQTTWGLAHSLLFLTAYQKLHPRDPRPKGAIKRIVRDLSARQTEEGAWLHGKQNRPNPAGYTVLNSTGLMCLTGLGNAQQLGYEVDENVIKRGLKYLTQSTNKHGGVGYSAGPWQRNLGEAGRTASAMLALIALKKNDHTLYPKMQKYFNQHMGALEISHASPPLHHLNGALLARTLGQESWEKYWSMYGRAIIERINKNDRIYLPGQQWYEGEDRVQATFILVLFLNEGHLDNIFKDVPK